MRQIATQIAIWAVLMLAQVSSAVAGVDALPMAPVPTPPALVGKGYHLVRDWEFGRNLTSEAALRDQFYTRYIFDSGRLDHFGDEWERYRDNDNHVLTGAGLALTARLRTGMMPGGIESGMLRSKWTAEYGYFEVVMKVPAGRGFWPAFWLGPEDGISIPELDVVEIVGNARDGTRCSFHFLHGRDEDRTPPSVSLLDGGNRYCPGKDFADGFHRFAVLWTPTTVSHYVDDTLVISQGYLWRHPDGRNAGPAHILLNLAVGGAWPGPPTEAAEFPAALLVHSIRVWQR